MSWVALAISITLMLALVGAAITGADAARAQVTQGTAGCSNTSVEAIPRTPGEDARYEVRFVNRGAPIEPEVDGIVIQLDPGIQLPRRVRGSEIDIHFTHDGMLTRSDNTVEDDDLWNSTLTVEAVVGENFLGYRTVENDDDIGMLAQDEFRWEGDNYTVEELGIDTNDQRLQLTLSRELQEDPYGLVLTVGNVDLEFSEDDENEDIISWDISSEDIPEWADQQPVPVSLKFYEHADPSGAGDADSVELTEPARRGGPATMTIFHDITRNGDPVAIPTNAVVFMTIHEDAGLSNPVEGGHYLWEVGSEHDQELCEAFHPNPAVRNAFQRMEEAIASHSQDDEIAGGLLVDLEVELEQPTARRQDELELRALGFAVGTTVIFWRDSNMNGVFDARGAVLCRDEVDEKGIAKCTIPITNPPFVPGFGDCSFTLETPADSGKTVDEIKAKETTNCNFINARDGHGHTSILVLEDQTQECDNNADDGDDGNGNGNGTGNDADDEDGGYCLVARANVQDAFQVLELDGTVRLGPVLPTHSTVDLDLLDFPQGYLEALSVGGFLADLDQVNRRTISPEGSLSFALALPEDIISGLQEMVATIKSPTAAGGCNGSASTEDGCHRITAEVTVENALEIQATPETALPNQKIQVTIQGFRGTYISRISIDGVAVRAFGPDGLVESFDTVVTEEDEPGGIALDDSGRWTGSVILPVNGSTLLGGDRKLQVRDSGRRLGETTITFPTRQIEATPEQATPGQTITIAGEGFPVSNTRGSQAQAEVAYHFGAGRLDRTVNIDAAGTFTLEIDLPRNAAIPSTNLVTAVFQDDHGQDIRTFTTHRIDAAQVALSPDRGPPGTAVTVTGSGFRPFTSVTRAIFGSLDLTPAPAPHTDRNGSVQFEVLIPQSPPGAETLIVLAGGIYVQAPFQVRDPLTEPGPGTPVAQLEERLGGALETVFHFNNEDKVWQFYEPGFPEDSTLQGLVSTEVYWIKVTSTTQAIFNGRTRTLTCTEESCWNLITW